MAHIRVLKHLLVILLFLYGTKDCQLIKTTNEERKSVLENYYQENMSV